MSANRSQVTKPGMIPNGLAPRFLIATALLAATALVLQATGTAGRIVGLFTPRPAPEQASLPADRFAGNHGDVLQEIVPVPHVAGWYGAIPQNSSLFNAVAAEQQRAIAVNHSEALQGAASYSSGWYGAIPQDSPLFDAVTADQQRAIVVNHSEALQGAASYAGGWYGAIPQDSPLFNAAAADMQREMVVNHGDALQDIVP